MPAKCCTEEPKNLDAGLLARRDQAIEIAKRAINEMAELGFAIHTAYSTEHFFIEPKPK